MADGSQDGIPVLEGVPLHDLFHVLRLVQIRVIDPLGFAVPLDHVLAPDNVVFF